MCLVGDAFGELGKEGGIDRMDIHLTKCMWMMVLTYLPMMEGESGHYFQEKKKKKKTRGNIGRVRWHSFIHSIMDRETQVR